jgi:hypothetical protein
MTTVLLMFFGGFSSTAPEVEPICLHPRENSPALRAQSINRPALFVDAQNEPVIAVTSKEGCAE